MDGSDEDGGYLLGEYVNALHCLFAKYGLCQELVTDNGPQFFSFNILFIHPFFTSVLKESGRARVANPPSDYLYKCSVMYRQLDQTFFLFLYTFKRKNEKHYFNNSFQVIA